MNLKRIKTKEDRMAAYAKRQGQKSAFPEVKPMKQIKRLPICVGFQTLAEAWGGKVKNE